MALGQVAHGARMVHSVSILRQLNLHNAPTDSVVK